MNNYNNQIGKGYCDDYSQFCEEMLANIYIREEFNKLGRRDYETWKRETLMEQKAVRDSRITNTG